MKPDKTTCWYDPNLYKFAFLKMGADIFDVCHGKVLQDLFKDIPMEEKGVIDIGCGNARVSLLLTDRKYTGVDLAHNIVVMCEPSFPSLNFIKEDVIENDIGFIKGFDIVLMNAFIDVMQYPLEVLEKVLVNSSKYVIIHRQKIHNEETTVMINEAYGGTTYHSLINRREFMNILKRYDFEVLKEVDAGLGGKWRSFLLKKI